MATQIVVVAFCSVALGFFIGGRRKKGAKTSKESMCQKGSSKSGKIDPGVCVVTGGSRGIGKAICQLLADKYKVCCVYKNNKEKAEDVVRSILDAGGYNACAIKADVGNPAALVAMFDEAEKLLGGPITALVNNAAVLGPHHQKIMELPSPREDPQIFEDELWTVLRPNVLGPLTASRLAIERMSVKNGGRGGAIVNISSGAAFIQGAPLLYMISKGALNSMQCGLVQECAKHGIRINTISPGMCDTDMPSAAAKSKTPETVPMGRLGKATEIADGVVWLLSDQASYVSGANIRIAGGRSMGGVQ